MPFRELRCCRNYLTNSEHLSLNPPRVFCARSSSRATIAFPNSFEVKAWAISPLTERPRGEIENCAAKENRHTYGSELKTGTSHI